MEKLSTLPLVGLNIYIAISDRPTKVDRQVLIPVTNEDMTIQSPFIVVSQLNEGGILGNDFLETNEARTNFGERTLTINTYFDNITIKMSTNENGSLAHIHTIQVVSVTRQKENDPSQDDKNIVSLPRKEQELLDKLLDEYTDVLQEQPGEVCGYKCKIKLKDDTPICIKPFLEPPKKGITTKTYR